MEYSDNNVYNSNYGNNINTDGTNMMVDLLANSEKLEPKEQRWYYNKNDPSNNVEEDDAVDDDIGNYKKPQTQATVQQSAHYSQQHLSANKMETLSDKNQEKFTEKPQSSNDKYIDDDYETLSPLEKRLRRLELMRKLGELRDLGCKVTNYSIDDDYYMMKYEYELHTSIRTKRNWMSIYNHMLVGAVKGIELLNNSYNPFDFSLKGLGNEVSADKNTYYEILGEIYEHHNVPGKKMNPWFRLFITLIGTVVVVGGKNNAHKFLPGEAKKLENDEDMIEKLRAKAVQSNQKQNNPQNVASTQMPSPSMPSPSMPSPSMNQNQMLQTAMNFMSGMNNQNSNQPANIDEFMNKEHNVAAQRVKDLEDLKKQELEYQQYQKMLMEDSNKFDNVRSRLEMSQQSPTSDKLAQSATSKSTKSTKSTKSSKPVSKAVAKSNPDDDRSTLSGQSTESSKSVISINKQLAQQLKSINTNDIKPSSISFGSNNKGRKNNLVTGRK